MELIEDSDNSLIKSVLLVKAFWLLLNCGSLCSIACTCGITEIHSNSKYYMAGGQDKARNLHTSRGKLLPRERIDRLIDPGWVLPRHS